MLSEISGKFTRPFSDGLPGLSFCLAFARSRMMSMSLEETTMRWAWPLLFPCRCRAPRRCFARCKCTGTRDAKRPRRLEDRGLAAWSRGMGARRGFGQRGQGSAYGLTSTNRGAAQERAACLGRSLLPGYLPGRQANGHLAIRNIAGCLFVAGRPCRHLLRPVLRLMWPAAPACSTDGKLHCNAWNAGDAFRFHKTGGFR